MPPPPIPTRSGSASPPPIPAKRASSPAPEPAPAAGRSRAGTVSLDSVFDEIDRDSSGYITFSEFVRWFKYKDSQSASFVLTDEVLQEAMKQFHEQDTDGNGSIDRDELAGLVLALEMQKTVLKGQIDVTELGLEAEEEGDDEEDAPPPELEVEQAAPAPEPAAPKRSKKLKTFYAKQHYLPDAPETIQLAVGNMSLMLMYHGETIATFPYLILKNWGKTPDTFWVNAVDFESEAVTKTVFDSKEGKVISDLMVAQAQEMAKLMKPGQQNKGSVGWEDGFYEVKIHTSKERGAGTDAQVHIELHGDKGDSGTLIMPPSLNGRSCYERSQVDSFYLKLKSRAGGRKAGHVPDFADATHNFAYLPPGVDEIGTVERLTLGHDGAGLGAGWHVHKVVVINIRTHERVEFRANRWLDKGTGDKKIEVTIPDDGGEVVVVEESDEQEELLPIEKEAVVGTFRALHGAKMRADQEGTGEEVGNLADGDIVECFEEGTNAQGQQRLRVLSPAGVMGWVSFVAKDGTKVFKTTTSWGAYRKNPEGDGCSGWMAKKGGMRTNWNKRW